MSSKLLKKMYESVEIMNRELLQGNPEGAAVEADRQKAIRSMFTMVRKPPKRFIPIPDVCTCPRSAQTGRKMYGEGSCSMHPWVM